MSELTFHESYGEVTPSLLKLIKDRNVSPNDFWTLEGILDLAQEQGKIWEMGNVEQLELIERFIEEHSIDGMYREPWPLSVETFSGV